MPAPREIEYPNRAALGDFYKVGEATSATNTVQNTLTRERSRLSRSWRWLFGEGNFAEAVDLKPVRDQRIKLMNIALRGATRLNGRKYTMRNGPALDLDDDEIVTVLCETIRILMLEEKIKERLFKKVEE